MMKKKRKRINTDPLPGIVILPNDEMPPVRTFKRGEASFLHANEGELKEGSGSDKIIPPDVLENIVISKSKTDK